MRFLRTVLAAVLGLMILIGLLTSLIGRDQLLALTFGPVEPVAIDFRTLKRPSRPNQYLMCPENLCTATPNALSPIYAVPVSQLKAAWLTFATQQPQVERLQELPASDGQTDLIQRSRLMRFPDLITVRFIPITSTQSTLAVYSRSQIGRSDFGVNEQRITSWLAQLSSQLPLIH